MNETEEQEYVEQIEKLENNLNKINEKILFYQEKMDTVDDYKELDRCSKELDKLLLKCRLDMELANDLLDMMEVEHFLECGPGVDYDTEY